MELATRCVQGQTLLLSLLNFRDRPPNFRFKFSSVLTPNNHHVLTCNVQFSKTVSDRLDGRAGYTLTLRIMNFIQFRV
jgi:hypothetical protein